ncbi:MAG: PstS family phosphate ABC transporter substrate-binding protein [Planctomycetota bacterium]
MLHRRLVVLAVLAGLAAAALAPAAVVVAQDPPAQPSANTLRIVTGDGPMKLAEVTVAPSKALGIAVTVVPRNPDQSRADALIDGSADLLLTGQPLTKAEVMKAIETRGLPPICTVLVRDALAVVVHRSNNVGFVTYGQLGAIYSGKLTSWSSLEGGIDEAIRPLLPPVTSDSTLYFARRMMNNEPFGETAAMLANGRELIKRIEAGAQGDTGAIGVVSLSQVNPDRVKVLEITKERDAKAFKPTAETVGNASYPLTRVLYAWSLGRPADGSAVKKWLDLVRTPAGQKALTDAGYFPLR